MNNGPGNVTSKYRLSPLAEHDRGLETATALLLLEIGRPSINFELRREHGFTEMQAAEVIREAAALVPQPARHPGLSRRN